jgi:hypothetical protein
VSAKRRGATGGPGNSNRRERPSNGAPPRPGQNSGAAGLQIPGGPVTDGRVRLGLIVVALILATVVVIGADYAIGAVFGTGAPAPSPTAPAAASR